MGHPGPRLGASFWDGRLLRFGGGNPRTAGGKEGTCTGGAAPPEQGTAGAPRGLPARLDTRRKRRNIEAARTAYDTDLRGEIGAAYGRGSSGGRAEAPWREGRFSPPRTGGGHRGGVLFRLRGGEPRMFPSGHRTHCRRTRGQRKAVGGMFFLRGWIATAPEHFPRRGDLIVGKLGGDILYETIGAQ